jgi:hypothetical protein
MLRSESVLGNATDLFERFLAHTDMNELETRGYALRLAMNFSTGTAKAWFQAKRRDRQSR